MTLISLFANSFGTQEVAIVLHRVCKALGEWSGRDELERMTTGEMEGQMPTGFRVMGASAGSGKTFRLVQAYLSCCLSSSEPFPFRRILALTFTNKAAQEMKDRVVAEIEVLADRVSESAHLDGLRAETGLKDDEVGRRARTLRRNLQRHYGELSIMTLDKFVGGLVRGFATDLQLEHDFSVELDTARLLDAAVDKVLDQLGVDGDLTELLGRFVEEAVEDDRDAKVRRQLLNIGKAIDYEQVQPLLECLDGWTPAQFTGIERAMNKEVRSRIALLKSEAAALERDLEKADLYDAFTGKWVMKSWLPRLRKGVAKEQGKKLLNGIENGVWAKSNDDEGEAAIAVFHDRLVALAEMEAAMGPDERGHDFRTRQMLGRCLPLVGTLTALRHAYIEVQREENVRTLGNLNRMISEVVQGNPAPYIFERTGERYDHIFIDEFQDTSVTQWHNLAVVVGETLAQGRLSLVVGDAKQAIYRWRNGDHRQLGALPGLVSDGLRPLSPALQDAAGRMKDAMDRHRIVENWRSAPEVVHFNNAVFGNLAEDLEADLAEVYSDVVQTPMKVFPGGVEVEVLQTETAGDRFDAVCQWIEVRIRQAMADGFPAGDIAILVRRNSEAKTLAEFLLSRKDPIVPFTDESLALGRHPAALAVVHLLEALEAPNEAGPVLRFLQALGAIRKEHNAPWDESAVLVKHHTEYRKARADKTEKRYGVLDCQSVLEDVVPGFDASAWSALPLAECIGHILRALEIDVHYPAHAESLIELAQERAAQDYGRSGFLTHWHRKGHEQSIRVLPGPDSVRILTVHKSKGLQFPVVITRFGDDLIQEDRTLMPAALPEDVYGVPGVIAPLSALKATAAHSTWERERAQQRFDEVNVAYVCTTRAEVRLHVVIDVAKADWDTGGIPKRMGRAMARSIDQAMGCNLAAAPYRSRNFEAARPLDKERAEGPEMRTLPVFQFHGISKDMIAGRKRDLDRPALGKMDARAFGTAVHGQLARIVEEGDVDRVLSRPWPWSRCSKQDWEKVIAMVQNVVSDPVMSGWFDGSGEVFNEREMVSLSGELVRPDRVVIKVDGVDIIDFKTVVKADNKTRKKHVDQVRGYVQALSRNETRPVRGFVFYCATGECTEVLPL